MTVNGGGSSDDSYVPQDFATTFGNNLFELDKQRVHRRQRQKQENIIDRLSKDL